MNPNVAGKLIVALGVDASLPTGSDAIVDAFKAAKEHPPTPDASMSDAALQAQRWLKDHCPVKSEGANDNLLCPPPDGMSSVSKQRLSSLAYEIAKSLCSTCADGKDRSPPHVDVEEERLKPIVVSTIERLWRLVLPCVEARGWKCVNNIKTVRAVFCNYFLRLHCA